MDISVTNGHKLIVLSFNQKKPSIKLFCHCFWDTSKGKENVLFILICSGTVFWLKWVKISLRLQKIGGKLKILTNTSVVTSNHERNLFQNLILFFYFHKLPTFLFKKSPIQRLKTKNWPRKGMHENKQYSWYTLYEKPSLKWCIFFLFLFKCIYLWIIKTSVSFKDITLYLPIIKHIVLGKSELFQKCPP